MVVHFGMSQLPGMNRGQSGCSRHTQDDGWKGEVFAIGVDSGQLQPALSTMFTWTYLTVLNLIMIW